MDRNEKFLLIMKEEKELVKKLSETQRFRYFLGQMQYIKYELGHENFLRSDCSGSVCLALLLATGCSIRVTADELLKKYFTKNTVTENDIQAAFFISERTGICTHVAGICGRDVVLNCVEPHSVLRSLSGMKPFYRQNGYEVIVRGLNRNALENSSRHKKDLFGPDEMFLKIKEKLGSDIF